MQDISGINRGENGIGIMLLNIAFHTRVAFVWDNKYFTETYNVVFLFPKPQSAVKSQSE